MADELTLKEALLDIVGGLKDPKQWQDTYEGLRRTRDAIPGVAESYIRGGLSQVAGQYGDLRNLATATSEFIPEKLRKVTSIAQFLSNPYLQTAINRAPTSEQVLEATPRITPEHEGAKDVEMMGGWTAPGGAGVVRDLAKVTKGMPIGAMMIGPESALWKQEMEFAARKLEAKKASKEQIRDATGLVRGLDKEWRTELGDQFSTMKDTESGGRSKTFGELAASQNPVNLQYPIYFDRKAKEVYGTGMPDTNKMTPEEFEKFKEWRTGVVNEYEALRKKGLTLGDVFKHDDLIKAYPEIADIRVEASGSPHFNGAFSIVDGKPVIKINESLTPVQARSTMLHELQHYIQRKEGWGTGGNAGSYTQQDDARIAQSALSLRQEAERMDNSIPFEQRVEQASDMLNRLTSSDKFGGDVKKIALDTATNPTKELENMGVLYGTDKNIEPYSPRKMYELMGGEAEARLIQARRDMTAEERAKSFPFEYQSPEYKNMELMPNYKLDIKPEQAIIHGREPGVIEVGGKRISGEPVPGIEGSIDLDKKEALKQEFNKIAGGEKPVRSAVVLIGDRIFTGNTHTEAFDKAIHEGVVRRQGRKFIYPKDAEVNSDLFMLNDGSIVDRLTASRKLDVGSSEGALRDNKMQIRPANSMAIDEYMRQAKEIKKSRELQTESNANQLKTIDLEKVPTQQEFEEIAEKGQMRQARTQEQDVKDILAGEMPANKFDFAGSYDDLAVDYESGSFVKRLEDAGLHVYDDKFGTVYVGKTPKDLELIKNAESPLESGLSYGYNPEDIAKFYIQRRGGRSDLGYEEYLRDLKRYQAKSKSND